MVRIHNFLDQKTKSVILFSRAIISPLYSFFNGSIDFWSKFSSIYAESYDLNCNRMYGKLYVVRRE